MHSQRTYTKAQRSTYEMKTYKSLETQLQTPKKELPSVFSMKPNQAFAHEHMSTRKKIFANSQQKKNAEIQFWIFSNRTLFSSFSRLNVKSQEIKRKEYYFLDFFCLTPRTNGIKLNFWKFSKKRNKINQRTRETLMP